MTSSDRSPLADASPPKAGKRERLIDAAVALVYEQGVETTTLADIAQAADVPVGNVYYYFKTKGEILDAVVDARLDAFDQMIAAIDVRHRSPKARLKALVTSLAGEADEISRCGCPLGTLCSELEKRARGDDHDAGKLLEAPIEWSRGQFEAMGRPDANALSLELISSYQGTAVLAHALGRPELMTAEGRRLRRWIDSL